MQCCVGVLCVRGCVYPALLDHCLAAKVVVVSALNTRQLEALCHISNTTAVSSILHCTDVRTLLHVDVYLCAQTRWWCHGFTYFSLCRNISEGTWCWKQSREGGANQGGEASPTLHTAESR